MKRIFGCVLLLAGLFAVSRLEAQNEAPASPEKSAEPDREYTGWRVANFMLLAAGLAYLGVKLGTPYFRGQTDSIQKGLGEARVRKAAADVRSAEVDRKLANLGADIEQLRRSILEEQDAQIERMRRQSIVEIERVKQNAEQQIQSAEKLARLDLQRWASRLALDLAEGRARERMTSGVQESLTKQFVESLRN